MTLANATAVVVPSPVTPRLTSPSSPEHCTVLPPPSLPPTSAPNPDGALKPLASFFDTFLETARAETQLESNQNASRAKQRRPTIQTPKPMPLSTLKPFLKNSVRSASAQRHRFASTYKPVLSSRDEQYMTQFRVPSSPMALQPTPYQVVLPVTPPTVPARRFETLRNAAANDNTYELDWDVVDSSVEYFCLRNAVCESCLFPPVSLVTGFAVGP
ncbi:hypothetical protein R3P38DRAFT_2921179 [Favolaschia claudopus]|uniref:Uncharacterized protein n=1 Tax=Favolaschia claudopus TaxID=2862362 RepID=A0AAW0C439_9AGAR